MTVSVLPVPCLDESLARAVECVDEAASLASCGMSIGEIEDAVRRLAELESRVQALRMTLVAEADERGAANMSADTGTDAWLARLTGEPREVLAGGVWLARQLQHTYHHTRQALAAGRIRLTQAKVIVRAADRAPGHLTVEQVANAEALLVAKATGEGTRSGRAMNARRLRQEARRMFAEFSRELADQMESEQLREEEERAERESWMTLSDNGDGTWSGSFVIPELQAVILKTALERLSSPRRMSKRLGGSGRFDVDVTVSAFTNASERAAMALLELIDHLPTEGFATGAVAAVVVHIDHDRLLDQLGGATLDAGVRISASQARRMACEAKILPAVLGGVSVPLDLGRSQRLHSPYQRMALSAMHDTCAIGGCERPFSWCEIHHPDPWSHGGATDLANGIPLCGFHHRRAHDGHFDLRLHPSGEWRFHRRR